MDHSPQYDYRPLTYIYVESKAYFITYDLSLTTILLYYYLSDKIENRDCTYSTNLCTHIGLLAFQRRPT